MNKSFILRKEAGLSLDEQYKMTAEERQWWLNRLEESEKAKNITPHGNPGELPPTPGKPPI